MSQRGLRQAVRLRRWTQVVAVCVFASGVGLHVTAQADGGTCDVAWDILANLDGPAAVRHHRALLRNGAVLSAEALEGICDAIVRANSPSRTTEVSHFLASSMQAQLDSQPLWEIFRFLSTLFSLLAEDHDFVLPVQFGAKQGSAVAVYQEVCSEQTLLVLRAARHEFLDSSGAAIDVKNLLVTGRAPVAGYVLLHGVDDQAVAYLWFDGGQPLVERTVEPWLVTDPGTQLFSQTAVTVHGYPHYLGGQDRLDIGDAKVTQVEDETRLLVSSAYGEYLDVVPRADGVQPRSEDFAGLTGGALMAATPTSDGEFRFIGLVESVNDQTFESSALHPVGIEFGWRDRILYNVNAWQTSSMCGAQYHPEIQWLCEDADGDGYGNPDKCTNASTFAAVENVAANNLDCYDNSEFVHPLRGELNYSIGEYGKGEGGCACDGYTVHKGYGAQLAVSRAGAGVRSDAVMFSQPTRPGEVVVHVDSRAKGWLKVENGAAAPVWLTCADGTSDPQGSCFARGDEQRSFRLAPYKGVRQVSFWVDPANTATEPAAGSTPPSNAQVVACRTFLRK